MNESSISIAQMDRYKGAMVGLAVGSALGQPVESMSPAQVRIKFGLVTELRDGGWRGLRRGAPAPEADLALVLGRQIVESRRYDRDAVARAYQAWYQANRTELEETTRSVLNLMEQGTPVDLAAGEAYQNATAKDEDCAALLRVIPLALFHARRPEALVRDAAAEVSLTHHGQAIVEVGLTYAFLLTALLEGEPDLTTVVRQTRSRLEGCRPPVRAVAALPSVAVESRARARGRPGDTLDAVWAAVCSLPRARKVLTRIVSGGEDAATAGALAGALVGARTGLSGLPASWVDGVPDAYRYEQCGEALFALAME